MNHEIRFTLHSIINNHWAFCPPLQMSKILYKSDFFLQNKPKVKSAQINVSSFITNKYVKMDTWLSGKNKPKTKPKQTQTKPNSKMPKMNVSPIITKDYEEKCGYGL